MNAKLIIHTSVVTHNYLKLLINILICAYVLLYYGIFSFVVKYKINVYLYIYSLYTNRMVVDVMYWFCVCSYSRYRRIAFLCETAFSPHEIQYPQTSTLNFVWQLKGTRVVNQVVQTSGLWSSHHARHMYQSILPLIDQHVSFFIKWRFFSFWSLLLLTPRLWLLLV